MDTLRTIPHLPVFRFGTRYESLDQSVLSDLAGEQSIARVSQANGGLIRRDLKQLDRAFDILQQKTSEEMIAICAKAADLFLDGTLPFSDTETQSSEDYQKQLSSSGGLPLNLVRGNMEKIALVLREMPSILGGLTRNLDLTVLDQGIAHHDGQLMSFYPATQSLGVVLPSNSPGVNSLWLPAIALRIPVVLKPGKEDPWTPWRLVQSFIAAGCPPEAFGYYPTDHAGSSEVLQGCGRALAFGDQSTVERHAGNPAVSVHGPGWSKVVLGDDVADDWENYVELIADSIARNGGRSCVNASCIVTPRHGKVLAEAVAEKLAAIRPLPFDDPDAQLSAFVNPRMVDFIDGTLDRQLRQAGASDLTAAIRKTPRRTTMDGATFLHPTLVFCSDKDHPLANTEFLLPYASVVEIPQAEVLDWIGPSLVVSVITQDPDFRRAMLRSPLIDRLNIGPLPTPSVTWDQPHEGNLFEFLYKRRAIQQVDA